MAVTETSKTPTATTGTTPATDGVLALLNSLQSCTSRADAYRRSLQCIADYLNSPFALLQTDTATTNISEQVSAGRVNGQNVFVAKGRIDGNVSPWLRSGMQGTAKVNAGRQPAWWVWLHRAVDSVRLQVWKW